MSDPTAASNTTLPTAVVITPEAHTEAKAVHAGILAKLQDLDHEVITAVEADLEKLKTLLYL